MAAERTRPIRVAFIAGEPTPYRVPHLRLLAQRPELDVTVVYAADTVQRRTWTVEADRAVFLRGVKLPTARVLHHDYAITPGIWPLLECGGFDLVVVGGWSLMATQLAILWARLRRVPYFIVSENHLREPRATWVKALKRLVLPRLVPHAAGWLVPGRLAAEHAAFYGATPERTIIFPNTIDVDALAATAARVRPQRDVLRDRFRIPPDTVAVLYVGRMIPMKAPDDLVRAVALAGGEAATPMQLVMVGPTEPRVEALAAELGTPVTFAGQLAGEDLVGAYVAADVFSLLSHRETWGVVVNEAMACGLPLVLSDRVGAAADLLEPGENGEIVAAGDVAAAARALARLADDPERRQAYGRSSAARIRGWGYLASVEAFVRLTAKATGR